MLKKPFTILVFALLAMLGAYVYFTFRVPPGVTPQSDAATILPWIGLATSVVGLLTSLVGLIGKVLDARKP